jgi:plasmid stabilization system protein ParE
MTPVRLHSEAEAEMIDAAVWYEQQQQALGERFLASVQDGITRIKINPRLFPVAEESARRCLLQTFPFSIIFEIKPDMLVIIAVMHHRRDPGYWKHRSAASM